MLWWGELRSISQDILTPPIIAIASFMIGVYFVISCSGIATGIQFGGISLRSPSSKQERYIYGFIGLFLIILGIYCSIQMTPYREIAYDTCVYRGGDAKQIVADGYNVFLWSNSGDIKVLTQENKVLFNEGNDTKEIAPAGGVIYILKNNESVFAKYEFLSEHNPNDQKRQKYEGSGIKQIIPSGEILYILKNNGNIRKIVPTPNGGDDDKLVDRGTNTTQMTISGSFLYGLKKNGSVFESSPAINTTNYQFIHKIKDTLKISSDGETLYFIKYDGSTWMYRNQDDTVRAILDGHVARDVEAAAGIAYILTDDGEVFRYSMNSEIPLRHLNDEGTNMANIENIAAYGSEVFAISKVDHNVYMYSENIMERSD